MKNYVVFDLVEISRKGKRVKIQRCPRCGGLLFWPYVRSGLPEEMELYRDKLKCFSCGRCFQLVRNGKKPVWRRWPPRDEEYATVYEEDIT